MSFLAWIVLGLLAGFIGSKLVNKQGEGLVLDVLLGVVGAIVGGWLGGCSTGSEWPASPVSIFTACW